jgi:hypothetical protein
MAPYDGDGVDVVDSTIGDVEVDFALTEILKLTLEEEFALVDSAGGEGNCNY